METILELRVCPVTHGFCNAHPKAVCAKQCARLIVRRCTWNRCDQCGRFIALSAFDRGAVRRLITPDSDRSSETYETLCVECA